MKTEYGLFLFIGACIIGGIFIGAWLVFLTMHYQNQESLFDFFTKPIVFEVPMSGWLALVFSLLASSMCFYLGKTLSILKSR